MKTIKLMVKQSLAVVALGWCCWAAGGTGLAQTPAANLSPDLQEVVKLSQQKMSDDIIVSYIKNSGKAYKLGADDIIYLNGQGVSQAVIAVLLQNSAASSPAAPAPTTSPAPAAASDTAASGPQPPPLDASPAPDTAASPSATPTPSYAPPVSPVAPPPMSAPVGAGFQDNFYADGGLNPGLWQTQTPLLSALGGLSGQQVLPALGFSPAGLQMSGIHREGQFMGIQSAASFGPPFDFNVTVTGLTQEAVPFEIYLVSADLQQWVSIAGHLGGRGSRPQAGLDVGGGFHHLFGDVRIPLGGSARTPEYGVWVNHTGNGQPINALGNKIFENPIAGLPYTVQVSLGADGLAAVTLLDAGRGLVASQNVPVGTGPFYVVLAGRDGPVYANWQSVQLVSSAPVVAAAPVLAPAPAVPAVPTLDYFQSQLAPYGNWVTLPDYGLCWQPAVAPGWRPYMDGGSWTYTDAGWYWQSDYPWGDIAFHYGRWAYTVSGWVWVPGYDYAPAWVVWRHADADGYVGWAPLVPGAVFVDGGWRYHGVAVAADFDFGIGAGFYVFVDGGHFWDHDFHRYVVPHDRLAFVFGHSSFENHYRYDHGHFINDGMDRDRMARLTHRDVREIQPRRLDDIRHEEEHRNVEVRRDDVHDFKAGARPNAQRTVSEHAAPGRVGAEPARGGAEPVRGGVEPARGTEVPNRSGSEPSAEPARGGAEPAAGAASGAHAAPAAGQKAPAPGQKATGTQNKDKKPNN